MTMKPRDPVRWLALAGVASPIALATATIVVAQQRPDYSHLTQPLSELGTVGRPAAVWMNRLGVVPAGLLVLLSAPAVRRAFGAGKWSTAGATALGVGGMCLAATGLSPWQGGLPPDFSIPGNVVHLVCALAGFLLIALAPIGFAVHARRVPALQRASRLSLVAGLTTLTLAFWPLPGAYLGAFQRATLAVFFTWLALVCLSAFRDQNR
jgi:hypothetical membrane protein